MIKSYIHLLVSFLFIATSNAQEISLVYGKITNDELKMNVYPKDSAASAVVIYQDGNTGYEYLNNKFRVETTFKKKIKILKKEGENEANITLDYFYKNNDLKENISGIEAWSYNIEDGKVVKTKLEKQYIFDEELNSQYHRIKFSIPNVKVGSVIEYKFFKSSLLYYDIPDWSMQENIPVMNSRYEVTIPEYFAYNMNVKGYEHVKVTEKGKTQEFAVTNTTTGEPNISCSTRNITYEAKDLPALKNEVNVWCAEDFRTGIGFELDGTRFPNDKYRPFAKSWEDVEKTLKTETYFVGNLKYSTPYKKELAEITGSLKDDKSKIEAIYSYVKSKIRWNDNYSFIDNDPREVFRTGIGNNAQINAALICALNDMGISASPVLMSTRPHGRLPYTHPSINKLNTFIVGAKTKDGSTYYMDGSSNYGGLNMLPVNLLVDRAWYFDLEQSGKWVDLTSLMKNMQLTIQVSHLNRDGSFDCSSNSLFGNQMAYSFKNNYSQAKDPADFIEKFKLGNQINKIDSFEVKGTELTSNKVKVNMKFTRKFDANSKHLYINPMVMTHISKNEFTQAERKLPIEFNYPYSVLMNSTIYIPDNYQVEELPKPFKIAITDNLGTCAYQVTQEGNKIQLLYKFELNQTIFPQNYYAAIRDFFGQVASKNADLIVLKKTN